MKPNSGKGGVATWGCTRWRKGQRTEDAGVIMRGLLQVRKG